MKHRGTELIRTERLVLRAFSVDDAGSVFRNWAGSREVTRFLTWPAHRDVGETLHQIEEWQQEAILTHTYRWCIELKTCGESIGCIEAVRIREAEGEVEIGCCIGRRWWHQGIATEAFEAVMAFFFEKTGARRIVICYDTRNRASAQIARKCGLCQEGPAKRGRDNSGVTTLALAAVRREDWLTMKKNNNRGDE